MNSKSHLIISLLKSAIRIVFTIIGVTTSSLIIFGMGIVIAEVFGILEEMFDKR